MNPPRSRFALLDPIIPSRARSEFRQRILRFARGLDWANSRYSNFESPILLVGSARGGTTLLANLVGAHPRINIFHERFTYGKASYLDTFIVTRDRAGLRRAFLRYIPHRIKLANLRWGVKICTYHWTRIDYDRFLNSFPNVRILFILRDGRDVVLSMMMRSRLYRTAEQAVSRWLESVETYNYLKDSAGPQMMSFRFEDLVANPAEKVPAICEFLGESYYPEMLDPKTWPGLGSYEIAPVNADKANKWREQTIPDIPREMLLPFHTALRRLGYPDG